MVQVRALTLRENEFLFHFYFYFFYFYTISRTYTVHESKTRPPFLLFLLNFEALQLASLSFVQCTISPTIISTMVGQTVVTFREKKEQPFGHPLCQGPSNHQSFELKIFVKTCTASFSTNQTSADYKFVLWPGFVWEPTGRTGVLPISR